ncbi:protein ACCELERATED CELL DEATH 6 [Beta vulgaris subsp. vulgaris]|uniref:protein ACCELERATED CELL DEATH 6 n=1 Tax=Beta vulgaris subsp. vulgaris TaxID=3555 RepID=UPI002037641A|nr:protein ACCELERATED CELL DEATH 6 [Beta vulgaris subsp. vulgaris]
MSNYQNLPKTMKEKELEKEKEKIMKMVGIPLPSIFTPTGNSLIPRVIVTNITVYAISTDIWMNSRRHPTNNLQHGLRVNEVITDMDLHTASSHGSVIEVQEVVHRKEELLWCKDSQQNLPLHLAVMNGNKEVACYLIRKYPQASYALNCLNMSPLYLAVVHHSKDLDLVDNMFRELVRDDHVVDHLSRGKSIVRAAIKDNSQEMLQTILKYQPELIKSRDEEGLTPLSYAAFNGYVDTVYYFLKKFEKSINYPNEDKSYPIHKACLGGQVDILKMFHSKIPESLLSVDHHGRTVLHLAAKERGNKLKHIVSYLLSLSHGKVLMKKKDENGFTCLELARNSRNHEVEEVIRRSMVA